MVPPRQPGPSAGHPPASLSITTSGWDGTGRGGGPGGIPARITVLSRELYRGADRASGGQRAQNLIYGSFLFMPWGQPRASTPHFPRFHPKAARSALQQPPNGAEIVSPMPTDTLKPRAWRRPQHHGTSPKGTTGAAGGGPAPVSWAGAELRGGTAGASPLEQSPPTSGSPRPRHRRQPDGNFTP